MGRHPAAHTSTLIGYIQSTLSKMGTVGTGSNCLSKKGVHLIAVTVKYLKNDRNWTNTRCSSYGGVYLLEVSVKRELTV